MISGRQSEAVSSCVNSKKFKYMLGGEEYTAILERRRLQRARLEYSSEGLKFILPWKAAFSEDMIIRHSGWILNREKERSEAVRCVKNRNIRVRYAPDELKLKLETISSEAASYMGVYHSKVNIRSMKTRWGSMSSKGRMSISTRAAILPDKHLRHLVYHELAHIVHPDHGCGFREMMSLFFYDIPRIRKEMRIYSFAAGILERRGEIR